MEVATLDETKKDLLQEILFDMNQVDYYIDLVEKQREVTKIIDGEEVTETETYTERVLVIKVSHSSASETAANYSFTPKQNVLLAEMLGEEYRYLWISLIGAYRAANGQIIITDANWIPNGPFSWPLPSGFSITSGFGVRNDPITGEPGNFHGGIDIAAPEGTPIIAAADGVVTVANATDDSGYGYGYYVRIQHADGYETLYAHCSALAVMPGQAVVKGQVIAYVGSTGKSTGNHLHFEVYQNGVRVDPLGFFS